MAAMGSPMTNKYAEGYPGKRYYGGCSCVDVVEDLARDRAKELFGCDYVNVQPHSGAQANMAVFFAMLNPGDKVLGMNLDHGGHLSHGSPVNMSGKYFDVAFYGVNEAGVIDYEDVRKKVVKLKSDLAEADAAREKSEKGMDSITTHREYEALEKEIRDATEREQTIRKELQKEELRTRNEQNERYKKNISSERNITREQSKNKTVKPHAVGTFGSLVDVGREVFKNMPKGEKKELQKDDIKAGVITLIIVILVGIILWIIPPTRGFLRSLIPF
jgi:hypothetical protein